MTGRNGDGPAPVRRFYRVMHLVEEFGFTESKIRALIRSGRLPAKKLDGIVLIPAEAWNAYIATAEPWPGRPATTGEGRQRDV